MSNEKRKFSLHFLSLIFSFLIYIYSLNVSVLSHYDFNVVNVSFE